MMACLGVCTRQERRGRGAGGGAGAGAKQGVLNLFVYCFCERAAAVHCVVWHGAEHVVGGAARAECSSPAPCLQGFPPAHHRRCMHTTITTTIVITTINATTTATTTITIAENNQVPRISPAVCIITHHCALKMCFVNCLLFSHSLIAII